MEPRGARLHRLLHPIQAFAEQLAHPLSAIAALQPSVVLRDRGLLVIQHQCGNLHGAGITFDDGCRDHVSERMRADAITIPQVLLR